MCKAEDWARLINAAEAELTRAKERFQAELPKNASLQLELGPHESSYGIHLIRVDGVPYLECSGTLGAANALALARWIQEVFEDIPGGP